jgi:diguanylate cyclase (GGDEF)-like protein
MSKASKLSNKIHLQVKNEFINSLYPKLFTIIPSLTVIASMLLIKLTGHIPPTSLVYWALAFIVIIVTQCAIAGWFYFTKNRAKSEPLYYKLLIIDVSLLGILWGSASIMLMPEDTIGQTYLMLILLFVTGGGLLYLAISHLASILYITCALAPLIISLKIASASSIHYEIYFNLTVAIACFWGFLFAISRSISQHYTKNVGLRLKNKNLSADLACANLKLKNIVDYDELTGLDTQKVAEIKFIYASAYARRNHNNLAIFHIHINNIEDICMNATTDASNFLSKTIGVRLQYCQRETDISYQKNNSEFILIVSEVKLNDAINIVANKVLKALSEKIIFNEKTSYFNSTIGISVYPKDGLELSTLIKKAEFALQDANKLTKNQCRFYDPETMEKDFLKKSSIITNAESTQ